MIRLDKEKVYCENNGKSKEFEASVFYELIDEIIYNWKDNSTSKISDKLGISEDEVDFASECIDLCDDISYLYNPLMEKVSNILNK